MTDRPTIQGTPDMLWYPGMHLDEEFPVPTDNELEGLWQEYTGEESYALQNVYGVYTKSNRVIRAIASIDLCEVVRDTAMALDLATGYEPSRRGGYSDPRWFSIADNGVDFERTVVTTIARALLNNGLVAPTEDARYIAPILQRWRRYGVYCIANTSTLPGCEPGTIQHTFGDTLPGCFDALVLPRNHDGQGSVTKAVAIEHLITEAEIPDDGPLIHIDDAPRHHEGFVALYGEKDNACWYLPLHTDNHTAPPHLHQPSPLAAFRAADEFFDYHGVFDEGEA